MLQYKCTICLNVAKIIEKQQEVCGIITKMKQVTLFLLIRNFLHKRQVLQKILTMVAVVKRVMMQTELAKMKLKLLYH